MLKRPDVTALLIFAALLAYAEGLNIWVMPVVVNMVKTANGDFSLLSRMAMMIGQNSSLAVLLLVIALVLALKRLKPADDRAQRASVINIATLLVGVYVVLQAWIFVDMAIQASAIVNPKYRKTASAPVTRAIAPTATQPMHSERARL